MFLIIEKADLRPEYLSGTQILILYVGMQAESTSNPENIVIHKYGLNMYCTCVS